MFKLLVAGQDVTDDLREDAIAIKASSGYPYFEDTEISNVSFTLVGNSRSEYDPLESENFFKQNWVNTRPDEWKQIAFNAPVRIEFDTIVMFEGVVIDVLPNVTDGSVRITASDKSRDLRESEVSDEFGLVRYVSLGQPDGDKTYTIPQTAGPIQQRSVEARVYANGVGEVLHRTDVLGTEGNADPLQYTVNVSTSLQTANNLEPDNHNVTIKFYEPLRWKRVDTLVKALVEDAEPGLGTDIDVPTWITKDPQFCTRGRVGWEVEGGDPDATDPLLNPPQWGYTGYVRDFIVNPINGDAFFLYGCRRGNSEIANSIIHYDYENDTYHRYTLLVLVDSLDETNLHIRVPLSCWRIATADFETFYIIATVPYVDNDYPVGPTYSSASNRAPAPYGTDTQPRIIEWVYANRNNDQNGWNTTSSANNPTYPPQLANLVVTKLDSLFRQDAFRDKFSYADTRRLFGVFQYTDKFLVYVFQQHHTQGAAGVDGVEIRQLTGTQGNRSISSPHKSKSTLGSDFGVDTENGHIYCLTVTRLNTFEIERTNLSVSPSGWTHIKQITTSDYAGLISVYNITDIVVHTKNGVTTIYGTMQDAYGTGSAYPRGRLVRFRSNNNWDMEVIKQYTYYISSARGGVIHDGGVYYIEAGSDIYGNPSPQLLSSAPQPDNYQRASGQLIEVSSGKVVEHGLVWRSSYSGEIEDYDYGAHTVAIPPLRSDGSLIHFIAGYGDVMKPNAFPVGLEHHYTLDDLLDEPQNDINNYQWITFGKNQKLYIERFVVSEQQRIWQVLKELAALTYCRIYFENDTFYFKSRAVPSVYTKKQADNYSVDENLISIDVNPLYTQIKNQIRGNIQYLLPDATPPTDRLREEFAQDPDSVEYIGKRILNVDMGRLTHHQRWWATMLAERLLTERSKAVYEADFLLTWTPDLKVGDIVNINIQDIAASNTDNLLNDLGSKSGDVQVVSVTHKVSRGDDGFTTGAVARTFETLPSYMTIPFIPDETFGDQNLTIQLPEAVGGTNPITYRLTITGTNVLPADLTFNTSNRQLTYTFPLLVLPKYGTYELEYRATDHSGQAAHRLFKVFIGTGILPDFQPAAIAVSSNTIYLIDNNEKKARAFKYSNYNGWVWIEALDITLNTNGEYQDATIGGTDYNLIVLNKSSNNDTLEYYHLTSTYGTLDTAKGTGGMVTIGGDNWQGIAFKGSGSVFSGKLLALNHLGRIDTYNDNGTLDEADAANLDLCSDYQSITAVGDTLYAIIARLSTVLAWDLSMAAGSGVALFPQEFVETNDKYIDYTGVAEKDGTLFVCRANRSSFFEYDT